MSGQATAWASEVSTLPHRDHKFLLIIIADGAEPLEGWAPVSIQDLAHTCMMDEARVLECLTEAASSEHIEIIKRTPAGDPMLVRLNLHNRYGANADAHPHP